MKYSQTNQIDNSGFDEELEEMMAEKEAFEKETSLQAKKQKSKKTAKPEKEEEDKEWNCRFHFPKTTLRKVQLLSLAEDKTLRAVIQEAVDFYFEANKEKAKQTLTKSFEK